MEQRVEARRSRTRDDIIAAAWRLAEREGLVGLTLRDLAAEVGMRAPSLYGYFDSKAAIYDAMFAAAYRDLDAAIWAPEAWATDPGEDPHAWLVAGAEQWLAFCQASVPRYQLMFTRAVPGWEPSPEAYAASTDSFTRMREALARAGIREDRDVDLWTALVAGLAAQQIANEPGGQRWVALTDRAVRMVLHEINERTAP
ncbi:TetR/AcrR family transcriptional regulator [uncultured Phycicoccus sp.]|uniref:TetR/AcrR family transcriptional regulator n=1 Tax=uncultured Phycicoccus sp. TaxID=661422 RepID=UPI002621BA16|nr:TetR/AcrR family transcriptional regulator [uncultured Phycicoccus sp.]